MFHQGSCFITTRSCSKSEMRARAVGQDSCCWLPGRHSWHAGRFFRRLSEENKGILFFFLLLLVGGCGGCGEKGVEGLTEDGRRDGASPSEALSIPPCLWDGGCVLKYPWQHCCVPGTYRGNVALCLCVFVRARVSRMRRSIRAYSVTLIFTRSDREATSASISLPLDGHLSQTPFFQPSTDPSPHPPSPATLQPHTCSLNAYKTHFRTLRLLSRKNAYWLMIHQPTVSYACTMHSVVPSDSLHWLWGHKAPIPHRRRLAKRTHARVHTFVHAHAGGHLKGSHICSPGADQDVF